MSIWLQKSIQPRTSHLRFADTNIQFPLSHKLRSGHQDEDDARKELTDRGKPQTISPVSERRYDCRGKQFAVHVLRQLQLVLVDVVGFGTDEESGKNNDGEPEQAENLLASWTKIRQM